jgi:hypothetical protein
MSETVQVTGYGVAACCSAHLLQRSGFSVACKQGPKPLSSPVLLLSTATARLLVDVFEEDSLLAGLHPIEKRIVCWGAGAEPLALPHTGFVCNESELLRRLWERVAGSGTQTREELSWTIVCSRRETAELGVEHIFGSRSAVSHSVVLRADTDCRACFIESVADGWLFLLPHSFGRGALLAVGAETPQLLAQSRLVAARIETLAEAGRRFPCSPRVLLPLCGSGWLACGSAATVFDPVCGEGVGNAVREAILAAATIRFLHSSMVQSDVDRESLLSNYTARLESGFVRHLALARHFYESGRAGPWWDNELALFSVAASVLKPQPKRAIHYRLTGFELTRAKPIALDSMSMK